MPANFTDTDLDSLIEKIREGDGSAFDEIFRCFNGQFASYVHQMLRREYPAFYAQQTEDICQEAWMVAYRKIRAFDPNKGEFPNWLYGIAKNIAQNYAKKKGNQPGISMEGDNSPLAWAIPPELLIETNDEEGRHIEVEDRRRICRKLINEYLDEKHSRVMSDCFAGYTVKEIAERHNISEDAVYKRRTRGYKRLKEELSKNPELYEELKEGL